MTESLAPIVLFVYNRPVHTNSVLNALAINPESAYSNLYIYCDGPKTEATSEVLENIRQVREIVCDENRFKSVKIFFSEINKGLATSIITGVNAVIAVHKKVIVLEDDILVGSGFLKYMNGALNLYEEKPDVGCIHAWNYSFKNLSDVTDTTFFLKGADCWGWATWENRWIHFEENGLKLLSEIKKRNLELLFNRNGTHGFVEILQDQIDKKNDSWAIRWHASLFLKEMYCLHPKIPIVKNIGLDSSGTHCKESYFNQYYEDDIELTPVEVVEAQWFFKKYKAEYLKHGYIKVFNGLFNKIVKKII
jgi:hypothetical protein